MTNTKYIFKVNAQIKLKVVQPILKGIFIDLNKQTFLVCLIGSIIQFRQLLKVCYLKVIFKIQCSRLFSSKFSKVSLTSSTINIVYRPLLPFFYYFNSPKLLVKNISSGGVQAFLQQQTTNKSLQAHLAVILCHLPRPKIHLVNQQEVECKQKGVRPQDQITQGLFIVLYHGDAYV